MIALKLTFVIIATLLITINYIILHISSNLKLWMCKMYVNPPPFTIPSVLCAFVYASGAFVPAVQETTLLDSLTLICATFTMAALEI